MNDKPSKKILCIEDDPDMVALIRLILGRKNFEVIGATGGKEGLEKIRKEDFDLVLLDLMMPDIDGWEVYQQMKGDEKTKGIPVIIITARSQTIDRVLGLRVAQVDAYITKPFSPQELLTSVTEVIDKKSVSA